jgi:NAD+ kinase
VSEAQPPIRTVGLVVSLHRRRAQAAAGPLIAALERAGVAVRVAREGLAPAGSNAEVVPDADVMRTDLVIVLGGDGTLLHAAGRAAVQGVPVLGVGLGSFGFLAEAGVDELHAQLPEILAGRFAIDERLMLRATVRREDETIGSWTALNDVVVGVRSFTHLIRLGISLDGEPIATYSADGLVVATPTGSTGYTLSVGGPVVDPSVDSLVIAAICPHTLQSRPVIVSPDALVTVRIEHASKELRDIALTVDGDAVTELRPQDVVEVARAEFGAKLVRIGASTFYVRLRDKLSWGFSH